MELTSKIILSKSLFYVENNTLFFETENGEEKELSKDKDVVENIAKLSDDHVLAISKNGQLSFWNAKGRHISKDRGCDEGYLKIEHITIMDENDEKLKCVIAIAKNESVRLYTVKGEKLAFIREELSSIKNFSYNKYNIFFLNPEKGLIVYDWSGEKILTFTTLKGGVQSIQSLGNEFYLVDTNLASREERLWDKNVSIELGISLWNKSGELVQSRLNVKYRFRDLNAVKQIDNYFIIISDSHDVHILDQQANLLESHKIHYSGNIQALSNHQEKELKKRVQKLETVEGVTEKYLQAVADINVVAKTKKSLHDYPHVNNQTYTDKYIPNKMKALDLEKKDSKERLIWDFFNRPIAAGVFNVLGKQEKVINRALTQLDKRHKSNELELEVLNTELSKKQTFLHTFGLAAVLLVAYTLLDRAYGSTQSVGLVGASGALIVYFYFLRKNFVLKDHINKAIKIIESNNRAIDALIQVISPKRNQISEYHDSLIQQFPAVIRPDLFDGDEVYNHIQRTITDRIESTALDECGLAREEIVYTDHKAIVLNDWSLIQTKDDFAQKKFFDEEKVHNHNELSFFMTKKYGPIFAVQFIQLVFLSSDKLDVFTTFYDFIEDEFISKQTYSFYYKDVTNFSRKDVAKSTPSKLLKDISSHAVELSLSVSSGESIPITIQNDETVNDIVDDLLQDSNKTRDERLEEIKYEIEECEHEMDLSEDEKMQQLNILKQELELASTSVSKEDYQSKSNEINQKINNIRNQIKKFKEVA